MTHSEPVTALILAGSRAGRADPMAVRVGVSHKALLPVDGTPMILRVIRALQACPAIGRIVVSSERLDILAGFPEADGVLVRRSKPSPSRSVAAIFKEFGPALLVTTADHALLTREIVECFLAKAPFEADATAAVAQSNVIRAAHPTTQRTWMRLRDGDFSGCNLFLLRTEHAIRAVTFWQKLEEQRKSPFAMARMIGLSAVVRYALKILTMEKATRLLSRRAGALLAVTVLPIADAAIDVDKPADLSLVEKILAARRAA